MSESLLTHFAHSILSVDRLPLVSFKPRLPQDNFKLRLLRVNFERPSLLLKHRASLEVLHLLLAKLMVGTDQAHIKVHLQIMLGNP